MKRREFLQTVGAAALAVSLPRAANAAAGPQDTVLRTLLDRFWEDNLDDSPETATTLGVDVGARAAQRSQLSDYSSAGRATWVATHRERLKRLRGVPRDQLSTPSKVDYDVVEYQYARVVDGGERFVFGEKGGYAPYSPYAVSQLTGPYQEVPDFLDSKHPVANASDADAYLARLSAYARALDDSTAALKRDAARGVLAPDYLLDSTLAQLAKQRGPAAAQNLLATSLSGRAAKAGVAGDWNARAAAILTSEVYPALERQIAEVTRLRPAATADAGVWKLPDGEAFYAGAVGYQTTTRLTPDEVHKVGLDQVAALSGQLDMLLRAEGLSQGAVGARLTALGERPDQLYPNTDAGRSDILKDLNAQTAAIQAKMPQVFKSLPASPVEIVRVPPSIEDGAPNGYAQGPSLDGKRPGRFYINLKDTHEWPRFSLPTLTYHEATPGHQWQGSVTRMSTEIPTLRRIGMSFAAYGEGWGLYAEQLADELGAYDGYALGKIGYLQSLLFRAVRLVVDTGMHARRWSREKATDYMVATTGMPRNRVQREIDRYCAWPGQACSYKVGHNEWVRLREVARQRAGSGFDIRAFHEVLLQGRLPLVVLEQVILARYPV